MFDMHWWVKCEKYVGYLRSGFEYFLEGFGPVHSPTQSNFSPSRSRQALSNKHYFDIKVHFHRPENPKKPQKQAKNSKKFCKTRKDSPRRTLQCGDLYQSIDLDELYQIDTFLFSK